MSRLESPPLDLTVPASPRAKRLPPGSRVPVPLAQIRKDVGLLRTDLQSPVLTSERLSALEAHRDLDLDALSAYVRALGGHLEVAAVFGVRRYPLDLSPQAAEGVEPDEIPDDL
jgi:hypothetical protein